VTSNFSSIKLALNRLMRVYNIKCLTLYPFCSIHLSTVHWLHTYKLILLIKVKEVANIANRKKSVELITRAVYTLL
jgi:hypothetical protein